MSKRAEVIRVVLQPHPLQQSCPLQLAQASGWYSAQGLVCWQSKLHGFAAPQLLLDKSFNAWTSPADSAPSLCHSLLQI